MRARISWATLAAILLAAVSVAVTLHLIDYPLGAAWDEFVKLRGVSTGRYHYYHPLFMIDLAQAAALVVQPPDLGSLAQLVRIINALASGVMVFATFMLARLVLPALPSLAAAAATAATPLFVVHARIFKEDIFVATFLLLALATLVRLLQEPAPHRAILLGVLIGCAAGSKYIGALILPFCHSRHCPRPDAGTGAADAPCGDRQCRLHRHLSSPHAAGDQASEPLAERCRLRTHAFDPWP